MGSAQAENACKAGSLDGDVASDSGSVRSTTPAIHVVCDSNCDANREEEVGSGMHEAKQYQRPVRMRTMFLFGASLRCPCARERRAALSLSTASGLCCRLQKE